LKYGIIRPFRGQVYSLHAAAPKKEVTLSNKLTVAVAMLGMVLIAASSAVHAQPTMQTFGTVSNGSFMDSPPTFTGPLSGGTLAPGTFFLWLNDTGWPTDNPGTPNNERWDYIFSTYFTYDPTEGAEGWDGYFNGPGAPAPQWRIFTAAGDSLGGDCTGLVITIRDYNGDGVLQDGEYEVGKVISSNLVCYINYSGGVWHGYCGMGNFSGALDVITSGSWDEELYISTGSGRCILNTTGCVTGVESDSWSGIKSIYRN
jgi:hypothetical protein